MQNLSLQQKLQQKLSPLQIQVIKLLEIPAMELEQRVKKELEENPLLEEGKSDELKELEQEEQVEKIDEDFSIDEYQNPDDIPEYKLKTNNFSKDDKKVDIPFTVGESFYEHLNAQLHETSLNDFDRKLAEYVIGNIDEDGYLRRDIESIADDLAFNQSLSVEDEKLEEILKQIQSFEPPGVGARDLKECLLLQVRRKELTDLTDMMEEILRKYFNDFTKKHYQKIIQRMGLDEEEFKVALEEILKLNPKPGNSYTNAVSKNVAYIIPDFILEEREGKLLLDLNGKSVPDLKISGHYSNMIKNYAEHKNTASRSEKEAAIFAKQKLDSAKWFIEAIKQRQNTLLSTMHAILSLQEEFFLTGDDKKLKPMHLKDVAAIAKYDISTISRVSNSKHIQTNYGIYPLKYFFSDAMQTKSGEEVSTKEIKSILLEAVAAENKRKPLTDDKLATLLNDKGYNIARRTIAKYREQLNIPVARMRKEL